LAATVPLHQAAARAADAVRSRPAGTRWFLACDNDADGLCAAAVTASALLRLGHRFTIRPSRDKTEPYYRGLFAESWDGLILLDKGSSHAPLLGELAARHGRTVLVVDHHNVAAAPEGVVVLNPRLEGLDGSRDASGSTTAQALAHALHGEAALAWAPTALAGAVGDWQHMGGWRGWNLDLVRQARASGHLREERVPRLIGVTLAEALAHARPPVPGLRGDPQASAAFVTGLGIDPDLEVEELDAEGRTRLASAVVLRHLAAGLPPPPPQELLTTTDIHVRLGRSLRQVFRVADACGRLGEGATGIAWLMGDAAAAPAAVGAFARYRQAIAEGIHHLRSGELEVRRALQVARIGHPDFTGMVAGLAVTHVLSDLSRPLAVLAPRPDGALQVSTRGTHEQVEAGMDLGAACAHAARAVGSEGGGHPVAAGAVVPAAQEEAFLRSLDDALAAQGFLR
jgi:single-stranded-DNA-specific exonuclease